MESGVLKLVLKLITDILLVGATFFLGWATYLLWKTANAQTNAAIIEGFQNEWHSETTRLMQRYLFSEGFTKGFIKAIEAVYGKDTGYRRIEDISKLLDASPLASSTLEQFEKCLEESKMVFHHPATGKPLFTAFQALDHILITFDRLALVRYKSQAADILRQYRPPTEGLRDLLQAYILIRLSLQDPERRNFKKDYMLLLHKLHLANKELLDECIEGLILLKEGFSLEDFSREEREEIISYSAQRLAESPDEEKSKKYRRFIEKMQSVW